MLRELLNVASWCEFDLGQNIVSEGSTDLTFFIVLKGEASVRKSGQAVASLGPGCCFGELGFLANGPRPATIEATRPTTALKIHPIVMDGASQTLQLCFHRAFSLALAERLSGLEPGGSRQIRGGMQS